MKKKRIAQYCCAALVAAGIGLNIQNAIADYGIGKNSFSLLAGDESNSGSNTNSLSNSNTNFDDPDLVFNRTLAHVVGKPLITGGFALPLCCKKKPNKTCRKSLQDRDCPQKYFNL